MTPVRLSSNSAIRIPLTADPVRAGFPSPAADYMQEQIDLNSLLTDDPNTTFLMRAGNDAIRDIVKDDFIVIDKARTPSHGSLIVAEWDGSFVLRRLHNRMGVTLLLADNPGYPTIEVPEDGLLVWGVVAGVVRKL
ncbi:LexA family transcriptional regulator [Aquitalea sp. USM4]|uniref:LexA family protein n=1 Tax=Aquitalea sp. USM4 TaxID=1590041 RepID=UPI00103A4FAF|nr:S24 family peptidase [Aquitalea sp. USM4]QBJ80492.1 hypothetical protein DKK66_19785 [Aquitalea sp. USM4]